MHSVLERFVHILQVSSNVEVSLVPVKFQFHSNLLQGITSILTQGLFFILGEVCYKKVIKGVVGAQPF